MKGLSSPASLSLIPLFYCKCMNAHAFCYNIDIDMETVMAKKHKYLKQRYQSYYVRVSVPKEIQSIIGKREIAGSLKTRNKQEAELRWFNVIGPMLRKFSEIKAQVISVPRYI